MRFGTYYFLQAVPGVTHAEVIHQGLCWMNFGGLAQDRIRRSMELFAREVMPHFTGGRVSGAR